MNMAKLEDLVPSGLTEPEYAELAMLCLDQAGMSLRRQKALRLELGLAPTAAHSALELGQARIAAQAETESEERIWSIAWEPDFPGYAVKGWIMDHELAEQVQRASGIKSPLTIAPEDGDRARTITSMEGRLIGCLLPARGL
jgi:hypothetical protein